MKQLLENIKQELIAQCKDRIQQDINYLNGKSETPSLKRLSIHYFKAGHECFTDLFDTEEEVLQWLEDEKMI